MKHQNKVVNIIMNLIDASRQGIMILINVTKGGQLKPKIII